MNTTARILITGFITALAVLPKHAAVLVCAAGLTSIMISAGGRSIAGAAAATGRLTTGKHATRTGRNLILRRTRARKWIQASMAGRSSAVIAARLIPRLAASGVHGRGGPMLMVIVTATYQPAPARNPATQERNRTLKVA